MATAREQYASGFKHQAVRLMTEPGLSLAQAAHDLGLNDNVLARWKKGLTQPSKVSRRFRDTAMLRRMNWLPPRGHPAPRG